VGDQLHPNGEMNRDTYQLIGEAYQEVEAKEAWCRNARPVSEIALVSPEALHSDEPGGGFRHTSRAEEGAARTLLETQLQFDVVDLDRDLTSYRLVILPDEITLSGAFGEKIKEFVAGGGKLLLSGKSGMNPVCDAFAVDAGLEIVARSEWNPDYIVPSDKTESAPVRGPFVIHGGAWDVRPVGESVEVLAGRAVPYFNRAWDHFCSHQHTPGAALSEYPAVTANGQIAYFAHDIFTRYRLYGQPLYRDMVYDAIRHLLGKFSVAANLPTAGRTALMRQEGEARYVLHLLYAVPVLRGSRDGDYAWAVEVIEDLTPLHDIECVVRVPEAIQSARLVPSGEALELTRSDDGAVQFSVPRVLCHQMVELSF
jgi:hypothetical protein